MTTHYGDRKKPLTIVGIASIVILLIFILPNQKEIFWTADEDMVLVHKQTNSHSSQLYTCPHHGTLDKAMNDNERNNITTFYHSDDTYLKERLSSIIQMANSTLGESAFNALEFDQYHRTYDQVKDILGPWKASQFSKYIKSNMTLYESACGEGFNLLMTLSILFQQEGVTNVTVYGNEYRATGVIIANELLQDMAPKVMPGSHLGQICQGDSTNLSFVPSETFDVAYTGYIDQLQDPFGFFSEIPADWNRQAWYEVCHGKRTVDGGDTTTTAMITDIDIAIKKKIVHMDQQKQEDWFASWVSELLRIVKPGGAVIIEQVAWSKCIQLDDWGGVDKNWWKVAISKYGWDVDEQSIYMDDMFPGSKDDRYHVSMQKRK